MIVQRVDFAACELSRAADAKAIGPLFDVRAHPPEAVGER
jgi:hypothetical protein